MTVPVRDVAFKEVAGIRLSGCVLSASGWGS